MNLQLRYRSRNEKLRNRFFLGFPDPLLFERIRIGNNNKTVVYLQVSTVSNMKKVLKKTLDLWRHFKKSGIRISTKTVWIRKALISRITGDKVVHDSGADPDPVSGSILTSRSGIRNGEKIKI